MCSPGQRCVSPWPDCDYCGHEMPIGSRREWMQAYGEQQWGPRRLHDACRAALAKQGYVFLRVAAADPQRRDAA